MALVKHNNNSISAVTSMASLTTGAMTFIKEQTASSSASVSFVDGSGGVVLDSTYPIYKFEFINIHPASDSNFTFQGSTNTGSSYGVTMTTTAFSAYHYETYTGAGSEGVSYDGGAEDLAQSTDFQRLYQISNSNDASLSGTLNIFNPSSDTFVKHYMYNTSVMGSFCQNAFGAGYFNTTSSVDAIKFQFDAGNIDSGTIKLYGIKDS